MVLISLVDLLEKDLTDHSLGVFRVDYLGLREFSQYTKDQSLNELWDRLGHLKEIVEERAGYSDFCVRDQILRCEHNNERESALYDLHNV